MLQGDALAHPSPSRGLAKSLEWVCRVDDAIEKVKRLRMVHRRLHVLLVQVSPLVLLRECPRADRQLQDEKFARFCEETWGFCSNHANVFIALHDVLDARERQVIAVLEHAALICRVHIAT